MAAIDVVFEVSQTKRPIDAAASGDHVEAQAKRRGIAATRSRSVSPSPAALEDAGAAAAQRIAISALFDKFKSLSSEVGAVPAGEGGDEASTLVRSSQGAVWTLAVEAKRELPPHDMLQVVFPKMGGGSGSGNQTLDDPQYAPLEMSSMCDECAKPAAHALPTITFASHDKSLVPSLRTFYCVLCYDKVLDALMLSLETTAVHNTYTFVVDLSLGVVLRLPGPYLLHAKRANGSAVALVHEGLSFVPAFLTEHGVFFADQDQ